MHKDNYRGFTRRVRNHQLRWVTMVRCVSYGLTEIGTVAVPAPLDLLTAAAPSGRKQAALALGEIATDDAASVRARCHATRNAEPGVRTNAVEALERIASPQALRTLIPFLKTARWCPHTTSRSIF